MKIAYISDWHLEFGVEMNFKYESADVLVVAGDFHVHGMGGPELNKLATLYRHVLYVPGNHDYYGNDLNDFKLIHDLASNVHILDQGIFELEDVVFIGATLWTDFGNRDLHTLWAWRHQMVPDYESLRLDGQRIGQEDLFNIHKNHLHFIWDSLYNYHNKKFVVISHHAPSERSVAPKYKGSALNPYFYTDIEAMLPADAINKISLWIHGHMHNPSDYMMGKCNVVCNPGDYYKDEQEIECRYV